MTCYMVACELNRPGDDYIGLVDAIERAGSQVRQCLAAVWLVVTDQSAAELRDALKAHLGGNDRLLVAQVGSEVAWRADRRFADSVGALLGPRSR